MTRHHVIRTHSAAGHPLLSNPGSSTTTHLATGTISKYMTGAIIKFVVLLMEGEGFTIYWEGGHPVLIYVSYPLQILFLSTLQLIAFIQL
jgi:hypothetical protein